MSHLKVEGHAHLVRDEKSNAILNTNMSEYDNYIRLKKIKEDNNKKVENLEIDMNNIKNDLEEIKNLLRNLANGS
jgi:hypothetical protein